MGKGTISEELAVKIKSLPDIEKIELVDSILKQLDKQTLKLTVYGLKRHASAGFRISRVNQRLCLMIR